MILGSDPKESLRRIMTAEVAVPCSLGEVLVALAVALVVRTSDAGSGVEVMALR